MHVHAKNAHEEAVLMSDDESDNEDQDDSMDVAVLFWEDIDSTEAEPADFDQDSQLIG